MPAHLVAQVLAKLHDSPALPLFPPADVLHPAPPSSTQLHLSWRLQSHVLMGPSRYQRRCLHTSWVSRSGLRYAGRLQCTTSNDCSSLQPMSQSRSVACILNFRIRMQTRMWHSVEVRILATVLPHMRTLFQRCSPLQRIALPVVTNATTLRDARVHSSGHLVDRCAPSD